MTSQISSTPSTLPLHLVPLPPECNCKICKRMCGNPCVPTPGEARKIDISSLCVYEDYSGHQALRPRVRGQTDPMFNIKRDLGAGCVFQMGCGGCGLHLNGSKPLEGKLAHHDLDKQTPFLHERIMDTWNTDAGRETLERYKELVPR